jgi:hypothetical protein
VIEVPFSVDGRSYVESFAQLSRLFVDFTNLLLDGVQTQAISPYMIWPDILQDPQQARDGMYPGKMFLADETAPPGQKFIERIETGQLPPQVFSVWEAISQLLRESASQNELRLGRLAEKSNITATEIQSAEQGSNVLVQHIAEGLDQNVLSPVLELAWYTTLQHLDESSNPELLAEIGEAAVSMLTARRDEIRRQSFRLRATGLSGMLALAQERRALIAALQMIGQSDLLAQQFLRDFSLARTLEQLFRSMRIDAQALRKTPEEIAVQQSGAPVVPSAGGPMDVVPPVPVNVERAQALRTPRLGRAPMPAGGGGRSDAGPLR